MPLVYYRIPFAAKDAIKAIPGTKWHQQFKSWGIPFDAIQEASCLLEADYGCSLEAPKQEADLFDSKFLERLYEHQIKAVERIRRGSILLNHVVGSGKTCSAIRGCDSLGPGTVLVVCPAIARSVWVDHIRQWSLHSTKTLVIEKAKDWEKLASGPFDWIIASYELFDSRKAPPGIKRLVCDEAHYLKNKDSGRTEEVTQYVEDNQVSSILLSGTPIANSPIDLWSQVNILHPGLWGHYWKWVNHYFEVETQVLEHNGQEIKVVGQLRKPFELKSRIDQLSHQVTRDEIKHLFPGVIYEVDVIPARQSKKRFADILSGKAFDEESFTKELENSRRQKEEATFRHIRHAFDTGRPRVFVLTHLRQTASDLEGLIRERFNCPVYRIDGGMADKERHSIIGAARAEPRCVVAATMHSIGVAIDLTAFTYAIFNQLYWQPAIVAQACGRFDRISGREPATIVFPVLKGSAEEYMARSLKRKLDEQSQLMKIEGSAKALSGVSLEISPEDWKKELQQAAMSYVESEY